MERKAQNVLEGSTVRQVGKISIEREGGREKKEKRERERERENEGERGRERERERERESERKGTNAQSAARLKGGTKECESTQPAGGACFLF